MSLYYNCGLLYYQIYLKLGHISGKINMEYLRKCQKSKKVLVDKILNMMCQNKILNSHLFNKYRDSYLQCVFK